MIKTKGTKEVKRADYREIKRILNSVFLNTNT